MALTPRPRANLRASEGRAWDVAMYPSSLPTCEAGRNPFPTSLSRMSSHDGQLQLSWSARSTLSSKNIELRATSSELRAIEARGSWLNAELRETVKPGL